MPKVYIVNEKYLADVKVCIVSEEYLADMKVYIVNEKYLADVKVYVVSEDYLLNGCSSYNHGKGLPVRTTFSIFYMFCSCVSLLVGILILLLAFSFRNDFVANLGSLYPFIFWYIMWVIIGFPFIAWGVNRIGNELCLTNNYKKQGRIIKEIGNILLIPVFGMVWSIVHWYLLVFCFLIGWVFYMCLY